MRPTVEENVDVVAIEDVSTSFEGLAGLILGEAGWKRVGGRSFGKAGSGVSKIAKARECVRTHYSRERLGIR
jgi:hypothetical protein